MHGEGTGIAEGLRAALATRELRALQAGWWTSSVAGWAFMVGLSVYAYREGGAAAVGLAALARMLPAGLAAPMAGLVADRHSRRDVLAISCALRAAALAAIAAAVAAHAPLGAVLLLAAAVTVLQTAQRPAQAALLTRLARTPHELASGNAAWSGLDNLGFLVGALVGGALIATTGPAAIFALTAAAFALAALAFMRIARDPVPSYRRHAPGASATTELRRGLRAVRSDAALALIAGAVAATTFVEGMVDVLVVVAALTALGLGDAGVGWLNAAWGAGGLAGGVAALALLHRGRLTAGLAGGAALGGAALLCVAAVPEPAVAIAMLVLFGIGYALVEIAELTLIQRLASDELLARAFGVTETLYWVTTGLGAVVAPVLVAWLGVRGALAVAGGCLLALVTACAGSLGRLEGSRTVPARAFALLRGVAVLAPVPLATIENLALRSRAVTARRGEAVIREGEPGETFYLVSDGTLDVAAGGRPLARLNPGECFGEIALLGGMPHTATVTAACDARLYALSREDFLGAVTALPRAAEAAQRFAAARLGDDRRTRAG